MEEDECLGGEATGQKTCFEVYWHIKKNNKPTTILKCHFINLAGTLLQPLNSVGTGDFDNDRQEGREVTLCPAQQKYRVGGTDLKSPPEAA